MMQHTFVRSRLGLVVIVAALVSTPIVAGASDSSDQATKLAKLRAEVDRLATDIADHKDAARMRNRALAAQKADLELELRREQLRHKQLAEAMDRHKKRITAAAAAQEALKPAVKRAIATIVAVVAVGLPFRRDERLKDLERLGKRLDEGTLTPAKAFARLWSAVEDERRLAKESAKDRQVVTLDGRQVLADVVHIGAVMLFFRVGDQRFGYAAKDAGKAGGWRFVEVKDERHKALVQALFVSFDQQVRAGFFEVPWVLKSAGSTRGAQVTP